MKKAIAELLIQCNGEYSGTAEKPSFHVQVVDIAENMDEVEQLGALRRTRVLSMEQCDAEGIKLPDAVSDASKNILALAEANAAERDAARADAEAAAEASASAEADKLNALSALSEAVAQCDSLEKQRDTAASARDAAQADGDAKTAQIVELSAQLADMTAKVEAFEAAAAAEPDGETLAEVKEKPWWKFWQ